MRYVPLVALRLRHPYYADERCPDFEVRLSPSGRRVVERHRLIVRPTTDGVVLITAVDGDGVPPIELADDAPITVRVDVRNVGEEYTASEVVQLYVGAPGVAAARPVRELRAFGKVTLEPSKAARVEMTLRPSDLAYYDVGAGAWAVEPGTYTIEVGTSSRDLPLAGEITLSEG